MEEISPKEILISIIVMLLFLALAIFINPFIKDGFLEDIRQHQNALRVVDDSNQFAYAKTTSVGKVFAYGKMKSIHPVSIPELVGTYGLIEKVTERYTQHSRQVCNGYDSEGSCTGYRTEYYYTWDTYKRFTYASDYYDFLSVSVAFVDTDLAPNYRIKLSQDTVSSNFVNLVDDNCIYERDSWWTSEGDLRFYYMALPTEFNASIFTDFNVDTPRPKVKVYYELTQEQVLSGKESYITRFDIAYYGLWMLIVVAGYYYWAHTYGEIE